MPILDFSRLMIDISSYYIKKANTFAFFKNISYLCPQNNGSMNKKSVLNRLSALKMPLMAVGVSQLGLFGSTVRGENTRNSDIDILIDFNAGQETYLNFIGACNILQDAFGKIKLDVVTKKGLSPYIGETILKEVEYV
jgi:predicted nucleotidyltransferase